MNAALPMAQPYADPGGARLFGWFTGLVTGRDETNLPKDNVILDYV
jgi:hypothetical protein